MGSDTPVGSASSPPSEDHVDILLRELLELAGDQRPMALRTMMATYPELADTLQRRFVLLDEFGVLGEAEPVPQQFGRFELLRRLGGGTTEVHLAVDPRSGEQVVVKILRHAGLLGEEARSSLRREALAASMLRHASIGAVLEVGEVDGTPYLVQPYAAGVTLAQWLRGQATRGRALGSADVDLVLQWLEQIARALQAAHGIGLVHRDVKPANILLPWSGPPRLLDFGLCQEVHVPSSSDAPPPTAGTLPYMAPELLSPRERPMGPSADVYALGVTLFECLTLRLPFDGETRERLCRAILTQEPPDPRRSARGLPRGIERVTACAMAKAAWDRYPTAAAMADDLARLRQRQPVLAPRTGTWCRVRRWVGNHRGAALLSAVACTLLALLVVAEHEVAGKRLVEERRAAELDLLAVPRLLAAAEARAAELVPGTPDQVHALEDWLSRHGEPLADRLPRLRERVGTAAADQAADPAAAAALRLALAGLERFAEGPRSTLAIVRERLAWARQVQAVTVDDHLQAWLDVAAAVAEDSRYGGLRLPPQPGLVPLGPDKHSGLFEFYHPRSAWPGAPPVTRNRSNSQLVRHDGAGIVFVLIPGGRFVMGQQAKDHAVPKYDPLAGAYSAPHEVELGPFLLSKYELTRGQWFRLCGDDPSYFRSTQTYGGDPPIGHRHPVDSVSARRCDEALGAVGLLLPTEAQWEYACGAGTATLWSFGDDPAQLRHHGNLAGRDDGASFPVEVGRYLANEFGLHDMHGNVAEWCLDLWVPYGAVAPRPGDGLRVGDPDKHLHRVFRGGGYTHDEAVRTATRHDGPPDRREAYLGCRPAMALQGAR